MLMSFYTDKIDASDDNMLARYLDDVEIKVGEIGIGEKVFKENGFSSFWWSVQKAGIEKWLNGFGVSGHVVFRDKTIGFYDLKELLIPGPVIIGTDKLGGLPGGHIMLAVGSTDTSLIAKDPYGDANTNYKNQNGDDVRYDFSFIMPHMIYKTPDKIRCMYFQPEGLA
jgi:hypothetical protein